MTSVRETVEETIGQIENPEGEAEEEPQGQEAEPEEDEQPGEKASGEEEEPQQEEAEEPEEAEEAASEEGETEDIEPPEHWSQADKEQFNQLPKDAKELYLRTHKSLERGYNEKFEEIANVKKEYDQIRDAFQPVEQQLRMNGMDIAQGARQLVAIYSALNTDPANTLAQLAQQFGQDPNVQKRLKQVLGIEDDEDEYVDPQVKQVREEVDSLKGQLQQGQQSLAEQQQAQVNAQIQAFAEEKDDQGNLKHPHFERVKQQMGLFLQNGVAQDLEDAYNRAVNAEPELFQEKLKAEREAAIKEAEQNRKTSVQKSKSASRNVSSETSDDSQDVPADLRGQIEQAMDQIGA